MTKLVRSLVIPFVLDSSNEPIALPKHIWYPPRKSWFMIYALGYSVLCSFHWIRVLYVGEPLPTCGSVFPCYTELPSRRCLLSVLPAP